MKKKITIQNPFRVTIYFGESHWDCHSFKKKSDALNKLAEILPDYFDKRIRKKEYQYTISLTHIIMTKNGVKGKKLLEVKNA